MRQQAQFHVLHPWPAAAARRGQAREHVSLIGCTPDGFLRLACLGELGHQVIGISDATCGTFDLDAWAEVCDEPYLGTMLEDAADLGHLRLGFDLDASVAVSDATLLCVEVPRAANGSSDLSRLEAVVNSLGRAMALKGSYHTVIVCSAVPPGTTMGMIAPLLEQASGGQLGEDFGIVVWPLPVSPGRAVDEFFSQERMVFGASDRRAAQQLFALLAELDCELICGDVLAAELRYFTMQAWNAVRYRFQEDIGRLCTAMAIDDIGEVLDPDAAPRGGWMTPAAGGADEREDGAYEVGLQQDALTALRYFARCLQVSTPTVEGVAGADVIAWPGKRGGDGLSCN